MGATAGMAHIRAALISCIIPDEPIDVQPDAKAWSRLAYDELLASQLALSLVRAHMRRPPGQRITGDGRLRNKVIAALPYRLTDRSCRRSKTLQRTWESRTACCVCCKASRLR